MQKYICCICISALLASCISRTNHQTVIDAILIPQYTVPLEAPLKNRGPVGLRETGLTTISYIPLETTRRSLVGRIINTIVTDSMIVIQSDLNKLMAFDKSGRYVRSYGNVGRGPAVWMLCWNARQIDLI